MSDTVVNLKKNKIKWMIIMISLIPKLMKSRMIVPTYRKKEKNRILEGKNKKEPTNHWGKMTKIERSVRI